MTKPDWQLLAKQLRRPEGEYAVKVAEQMNISNRQMNLEAIEAMNIKENDRLLEIGMGNGFFISDLFNKNTNIHYTGLDYSSEMIAKAKSFNIDQRYREKVSFVCADFENNRFSDNSFNQIFTINTVYFWEDVNMYLDDLQRIIKPDGNLLLGFRPKKLIENYPFTAHGFTMYAPEDLASILEKQNCLHY